MTVVDPNTGLTITCQPWEYAELCRQHGWIKTTYETNTVPKPAEPLIKDEGLRYRLRAYAKMDGWKSARYSPVLNAFVHQGDMFFTKPSWELDQLEPRGYIPITELCGEEEE